MKFVKPMLLGLVTTSLMSFASLGFSEASISSGFTSTGKANESIPVSADFLSSDVPGFKAQVVAIRELNDFATTGLAISSRFWPKLRIVCDGVVKDETTGIVLSPIKRLRLVATADVTNCKNVVIEKPADAEGVTFSADSSKIEWYAIGMFQ